MLVSSLRGLVSLSCCCINEDMWYKNSHRINEKTAEEKITNS